MKYKTIIEEFGSIRNCINELKIKNLRDADLRGVDLSDVDLRGVDLSEAINLLYNKWLQLSEIGSCKRMTTYLYSEDRIHCGCFTGTLQEFIRQIKNTYSRDQKHYKEYSRAVQYLFWTGRLAE